MEGQDYNQQRRERYKNDEKYRELVKQRAKKQAQKEDQKERNRQRAMRRSAIEGAGYRDLSRTDMFKKGSKVDMDNIDVMEKPDSSFEKEDIIQNTLKPILLRALNMTEYDSLIDFYGLFGKKAHNTPKDNKFWQKRYGITYAGIQARCKFIIRKIQDYLQQHGKYIDIQELQKILHENTQKNILRLTESDLHNIIKESVRRIINKTS